MRLPLFATILFATMTANAAAQTPARGAQDPRTAVLAGDRFQPLKYDEMTPEQKAMIDHLLAGERRGVGGPFNVLLRSPEAGDLAQQFGETRRFRTVLPKDVAETIVIMTARFWTSHYEWNVHKSAALQNGVKPEIVDAIANGRRPSGMSPEMEVAYNFMAELLTTHQVTDATFEAAKARYEERGVVDMMELFGWYTIVSMALNVDRYPLPQGAQVELKPMETPIPVVGLGFATPVPGTPSAATAQSSVNGKALNLRGGRFKPLTYAQMSPEQKQLTDTALAGRGPGGSFNMLLRSPEAGDRFFALGEQVRFRMALPDKLKEMALSITARFWTAQTEWASHGRSAVQAGFSEEKLKAIGEGRRPEGLSADERAIYDFMTELYRTRQVSDATFAAAKAVVGERGIVDLIISNGFYQVVAMLMNVDRMPAGAGQQAQLAPLAKPIP